MFGSLVHKLQNIASPLASPISSPISSPKASRRRYAKTPAYRNAIKQEYREVQSDPEDSGFSGSKKSKIKRKIDKNRIKQLDISAPLHLNASKSLGRLDGLKQLQRLSDYEHYLESLLNENGIDDELLNRAKSKCKQAQKRSERENDLDRVQDVFPNDCLRLYELEAQTMKVKGLMRKRSGAAARLQRALSTKSLRSDSPPSRTTPPPAQQRQFIMEAPVQFTSGVQCQDRHLFLFNDLLLIAKGRSGGNFKLKEKVRVSEIYLNKCVIDDVTEVNKSEDTSFVIGWPTTNVVVTFSTQAARDLWWNKLIEVFKIENEKEPCSTNIQVLFNDLNTSIEYCKTFSIGPEETAKDCIKLALQHLEMRNLDVCNFQLWVKTARDESAYPLIGHERPFAIKLSCLRDYLSSEDGFDLDHCNNIHDPVARCHFILRNVNSKCPKKPNGSKKSSNKAAMRIGHVFSKSFNKLEQTTGCLFGLPLSKLSDGETLPKPVMSMLYQLFAKGPFIQGIFRKSANARLVRELREKLDTGEDVSWEHIPVLVTAALLKDFLRSLPDPLLTSALYDEWRSVVESPNLNIKLHRMKGVLKQLPKANYMLLIHFLCVLHHIARRSCHTLMSAGNLGVCVGPSLLWSDCPNVGDDLRIVPSVVECLVSHCEFLFGSHVSSLLGDLRDSGTEESDSMKRDDSSIDSLECSPPPRKDKISLSRDSGLTMSDSQLYTPDEEESGSNSSSGYDRLFESHNRVVPCNSMPNNYIRVYGGWEERLNPNFQRQAWFRQRSRRMLNPTKPEVRRSASDESLLDNQEGPVRHSNKVSYVKNQENDRCKKEINIESLNTYYPKKELNVKTIYGKMENEERNNYGYDRRYGYVRDESEDKPSECEDSSTLSDEDCTPHVSRSNSRGNEVVLKLPSSADISLRGRLKRKEDRLAAAAHRSRSLPPPPYRPPPPPGTTSRRAPITSYYLGDSNNNNNNNNNNNESHKYAVSRNFVDEESYV